MIAILKREWKSYFQNITGWLFIAAVLALYGLYFLAYNLRAGYPYVSYTLSAISFIMLIAVPILTMRSMAEERHSRTDQLVLTAPVSLGKMIFGKFLAMVGVFTVAVAVIAVTPLVLAAFGTVPMGENYVAVLGFWLYGCTCIAVGMLASALTESQVIAAVVAFAFLFLGYMMNSITGLIGDHLITKVLGAYDLYTPLQSFMSGWRCVFCQCDGIVSVFDLPVCAEETLEHDDEKTDHRNVFRGDDCGGICGCGCSQHGGKGDAILLDGGRCNFHKAVQSDGYHKGLCEKSVAGRHDLCAFVREVGGQYVGGDIAAV